MREMIGATEPDYGNIFDNWLVDEGSLILVSRLNKPKVETTFRSDRLLSVSYFIEPLCQHPDQPQSLMNLSSIQFWMLRYLSYSILCQNSHVVAMKK